MVGCKVRVIPGGGYSREFQGEGDIKKINEKNTRIRQNSGKKRAEKLPRKKKVPRKKKPLSPKIPPNRGIYYASSSLRLEGKTIAVRCNKLKVKIVHPGRLLFLICGGGSQAIG